MISKKILDNLEYGKILSLLSGCASITGTREKILLELPAETFEDTKYKLDFTAEADRVAFFYMRNQLENFDSIADVTRRAKMLSILSYGDILRVMRILRSSRIFIGSISSLGDDEFPIIKNHSSSLYEDKRLEERISETFLSEEEISDNASPTLYSIRQKIRRLNLEIKEKLASIVKDKGNSRALQDSIVTSREGRFVVPVKTEFKGQIKGLIHDYSQSGATIFVEPMEVVEMNNELRILYADEREEIERILEEFTRTISSISDFLLMTENTLYELDCAFAKAKYAKLQNAEKPELSSDGSIDIIGGRHPLLNKSSVVPVSVKIDNGYNFVLISGPNTGGKTVTLKMTGLFSLMAMSGMYIPAKTGSKISFFSSIFSDIGDEQSIEQNLSTFSSHIMTLKYIIENVNSESLVLLDEVGAGTDPQEGAALGVAVMEYLLKKNCKGIITTHYSELKEFSFTTDKVINASMEFDMRTLAPTYKLIFGAPGASKALEISRRLGLSEEIIQSAKSKISPLKLSFDGIIAKAEAERLQAKALRDDNEKKSIELNNMLQKLEAEKEKLLIERENITKTAKIEAKRILQETAIEAEEILAELKSIYNKAEIGGKDLIDAAKLKNAVAKMGEVEEELPPEMQLSDFSIHKCKVGDRVFISSLATLCTVLSINIKKSEVVVAFGNMNFTAKPDNIKFVSKDYLKYIDKQSAPKPKKKKYEKKEGSVNVSIKTDVNLQLNIVGMRFFEAQQEVSQFLDRAIVSGADKVTIIHGIGSGILKKMVADEVRKNNLVKEFRHGEYGEGEGGVTIVEFSK